MFNHNIRRGTRAITMYLYIIYGIICCYYIQYRTGNAYNIIRISHCNIHTKIHGYLHVIRSSNDNDIKFVFFGGVNTVFRPPPNIIVTYHYSAHSPHTLSGTYMHIVHDNIIYKYYSCARRQKAVYIVIQ